jgi:predicted TIM-barrel fold metal-dependent hydrolase
MRTITLEEHFATPRFLDGPGRDLREQAEKFNNARALKLIPQLCDLGDKRIAEMDAAGIDMQIVSLTAPGVEQLEAAEAIALAADTNDFVADAIKKHPTRFGGFAALPTAAPDKAAQELERRVRGQKFAGAIINGHNRGRYLDDKFFWPILESAELADKRPARYVPRTAPSSSHRLPAGAAGSMSSSRTRRQMRKASRREMAAASARST